MAANGQKRPREIPAAGGGISDAVRAAVADRLDDGGGASGWAAAQALQTIPGIEGVPTVRKRIGTEEVARAQKTLNEYIAGKSSVDKRIQEAELWYRSKTSEAKKGSYSSGSAWTFNAIAIKHADAMENYMICNFLPREELDIGEAEALSDIVPALMERIGFRRTYGDVEFDKLKTGTGCYGVFWDASADGGLGEIAIKPIDVLALYWEPGVSKLDDSRNIFFTTIRHRDEILAQYPHVSEQELGIAVTDPGREHYHDDNVPKDGKVKVVDWYYRRLVGGRHIVHLCKFCGSAVLYASENAEETAERGIYDHGSYPFKIDILYPIKDSPAGFGIVDIARNPQEYIDGLDEAIMQNAIGGARARYWVSRAARIKKTDFTDMQNQLVEYDGEAAGIVPIKHAALDSIYVSVRDAKIAELKEVVGNRDVTQGGTANGVTAASAIAALVETGSKMSRDSAQGSRQTYIEVVEMVVELIRQFYTTKHRFRIIGKNGEAKYIAYDNARIIEQHDPGDPNALRRPVFDVEVTAEKASYYTRLAQNELVLRLYEMGFFDPARADASLAAIDAMSFDQKEEIRKRIEANGTMYQVVTALQATNAALAAATGNGEVRAQVAAENAQAGAAVQAVKADIDPTFEPLHMKNMRERVAGATAV